MLSPIAFVSRYDENDKNKWLKVLSKAMPEERVLAFNSLSDDEKKQVQVAIVANPDPADIRQLTNLQWIHSIWAGVERLVLELGENAPPIVRLVDPQMSRNMAEAVLTWCLYLQREIPQYRQQQLQKLWKPRPYRPATDVKVGILGMGTLGQAAANMLKVPGFQIAGWSRSQKDIAGVECFSGDDELDVLLQSSDILVCLLPLTEQTNGLMDKNFFERIKPQAALINFARGPIIQSDALLEALQSGKLSHAVLDVFNKEPLPDTCPYWLHSKITVLPHVAALTMPASASSIVAQNIATWRKSGNLPKTVDMKQGY